MQGITTVRSYLLRKIDQNAADTAPLLSKYRQETPESLISSSLSASTIPSQLQPRVRPAPLIRAVEAGISFSRPPHPRLLFPSPFVT